MQLYGSIEGRIDFSSAEDEKQRQLKCLMPSSGHEKLYIVNMKSETYICDIHIYKSTKQSS
jgi:hypothetical protein